MSEYDRRRLAGRHRRELGRLARRHRLVLGGRGASPPRILRERRERRRALELAAMTADVARLRGLVEGLAEWETW